MKSSCMCNPETHSRRVRVDSFVALETAEGELQLGVSVPVRVRARGSGALLPWGRVAAYGAKPQT